MKKQRRKLTKEFKLQVILETLKEHSTVKELCQKYEVHPNQISKWKQDFLDNALLLMDRKKESVQKSNSEKETERLYSKIGQLQMEVDYLKKKLY